jgi:hypothetical protein
MTPCEENLLELLAGLNIRAVEGVAFLDREAPVRHLASATMRGLAGHALRRHSPEMIDRWFKPGAGGDTPPAYVVQPLNRRATSTNHFPFRILTWDPPGELLPSFCRGIGASVGAPFGEGGARLVHVEWDDVQRLEFTGELRSEPTQRILLHTPFRYKIGERWADERTLTLETLVRATATRLNLLGRAYGNDVYLHARPFIDAAAGTRETSRRLRMVHPRRRSSTQLRDIELSGIVGEIVCGELPTPIMNLLFTAGVFHIGKHTAEGCGHLLLAQSVDGVESIAD